MSKETVKSLRMQNRVLRRQLQDQRHGFDARSNALKKQEEVLNARAELLESHYGQIRRMVASNALNGMLSSAPITDRTRLDVAAWAAVAVALSDALLERLGQVGHLKQQRRAKK